MSNPGSKRSSNDSSDAPPNQRSRIDGAGDNASGADATETDTPNTITLTLNSGQAYRFDSWNVGTFMIRGGSSGGFHVDGSKVQIFDTNGKTLFSEGGYSHRVSFKDNPENGTTTVTLTRGRGSPPQQSSNVISSIFRSIISTFGGNTGNIVSGEGIVTIGSVNVAIGGGNIINVTSGGRTTEKQPPIKIQAFPNEHIDLRGSRDFVIDGNGAILKQTGCSKTTVNGNLQSVTLTGTGNITVHGQIEGGAQQTGTGNLIVRGQVAGNVQQTGTGNFSVHGKVSGYVRQTGVGNLNVHGKVLGYIAQTGCGNLKVDDSVQGNVSQVGVGTLHIGGDVHGDISQVGVGNLIIDGAWHGNDKTKTGFGRLVIKN